MSRDLHPNRFRYRLPESVHVLQGSLVLLPYLSGTLLYCGLSLTLHGVTGTQKSNLYGNVLLLLTQMPALQVCLALSVVWPIQDQQCTDCSNTKSSSSSVSIDLHQHCITGSVSRAQGRRSQEGFTGSQERAIATSHQKQPHTQDWSQQAFPVHGSEGLKYSG